MCVYVGPPLGGDIDIAMLSPPLLLSSPDAVVVASELSRTGAAMAVGGRLFQTPETRQQVAKCIKTIHMAWNNEKANNGRELAGADESMRTEAVIRKHLVYRRQIIRYLAKHINTQLQPLGCSFTLNDDEPSVNTMDTRVYLKIRGTIRNANGRVAIPRVFWADSLLELTGPVRLHPQLDPINLWPDAPVAMELDAGDITRLTGQIPTDDSPSGPAVLPPAAAKEVAAVPNKEDDEATITDVGSDDGKGGEEEEKKEEEKKTTKTKPKAKAKPIKKTQKNDDPKPPVTKHTWSEEEVKHLDVLRQRLEEAERVQTEVIEANTNEALIINANLRRKLYNGALARAALWRLRKQAANPEIFKELNEMMDKQLREQIPTVKNRLQSVAKANIVDALVAKVEGDESKKDNTRKLLEAKINVSIQSDLTGVVYLLDSTLEDPKDSRRMVQLSAPTFLGTKPISFRKTTIHLWLDMMKEKKTRTKKTPKPKPQQPLPPAPVGDDQ